MIHGSVDFQFQGEALQFLKTLLVGGCVFTLKKSLSVRFFTEKLKHLTANDRTKRNFIGFATFTLRAQEMLIIKPSARKSHLL